MMGLKHLLCSKTVYLLCLQSIFIRFDAIVSADAFENLKPAPDIFFAASKILNVPPGEVCIPVPNILVAAPLVFISKFRIADLNK